MTAIIRGDEVSLIFTKVLDQMRLGINEEDEGNTEIADRSYWEKRASKRTLEVTDAFLQEIVSIDPKLAPKYNKFYIGLTHEGTPNNFISFKPKKEWLWISVRMDRSEEMEQRLEAEGLDDFDYDSKWGNYRIRVTNDNYKKYISALKELFKKAYDSVL